MRLEKIDILRGIAVILMILFHLNYILLNVFNINTLNFNDLIWKIIGTVGGRGFIIIAGFSFFLSLEKYGDKIYKKYFKVILNLTFLSLLITFITYFFFIQQVIWFGILHFFSISFIILLVIHRFGYYNFILAFILFISLFYFPTIIENKYLVPLGFIYNGFYSADYYPLIPYFFYILLGFLSAKILKDLNLLNIFYLKNKNIFLKGLIYIGQRSLLIYVIHVPIICIGINIILKINNY